MKQKHSRRGGRKKPKTVLRLPDLEHARTAVLNNLTNVDAQRGHRHAIAEFVEWYCSEPRLAFNRVVVLRYRSHLESRRLTPGTVNLRLGAVRRLAFEAADCGLLSSDLVAGIRRVNGLKKNGIRQGNWLTADQARSLWQAPDTDRMREKRDRALLALMLACGLRRHEAVTLRAEDLQQREEHWAIVDLVGKAGHIRTIPMPEWVHVEADPPSRAASFISHAFALGLRTVFRARESYYHSEIPVRSECANSFHLRIPLQLSELNTESSSAGHLPRLLVPL